MRRLSNLRLLNRLQHTSFQWLRLWLSASAAGRFAIWRTGSTYGRMSTVVILASVLVASCESGQQILYAGLSQTEANEMLALMYAEGLPAEKTVKKNDTYTVTTSRQAFAPSMAILMAHGLPREKYATIGEVFSREGFVSSPLEERARLNFAFSQEMSRTISSIDGVTMARVHLVMPEPQKFTGKTQASSASIFVKHRADVDLSDAVGKIKSIAINSVENLPYENVTVAFFAAKAIEPLAVSELQQVQGQTKEASYGRRLPVFMATMSPGSTFVSFLIVFTVVCGIGISSWWWVRSRRQGIDHGT